MIINLIVIIVDDIAGRDLLQVRVEALVRKQEESVTESVESCWERLFINRECDLSWFGGEWGFVNKDLKLDTGIVDFASSPIVSGVELNFYILGIFVSVSPRSSIGWVVLSTFVFLSVPHGLHFLLQIFAFFKIEFRQNPQISLGTFQKLLSGFFPLRGGGGVPPLSGKGFWAGWFSVKGGRGVPPNSAKENPAKKQVFKVRKLHFLPVFIHF